MKFNLKLQNSDSENKLRLLQFLHSTFYHFLHLCFSCYEKENISDKASWKKKKSNTKKLRDKTKTQALQLPVIMQSTLVKFAKTRVISLILTATKIGILQTNVPSPR